MDDFERIPVYRVEGDIQPESSYKEDSGNGEFRRSRLTWLTLFVLLILYPALSVLSAEDPATLFGNMSNQMLMVMLVSTIILQWCLFLLIYLTCLREQTGLIGLGLRRFTPRDIAWGVSLLLVAFLILAFLSWLLGLLGLPLPGEISMLIPTDTVGRVIWVAVSISAGVCEEVAFRGYLMTRLRLIGKFKSWTVPVIVSSVAFGACHYSYQGLPGLILITVYGLLLALLFVRTGRLWPCIVAHFFQDFLALFVPQ
ncbi:MAG: type II CAAX endopeptidase family protein [bacterium]